MKKNPIHFIFLLLVHYTALGQSSPDSLKISSKRYRHAIGFTTYIALDNFAQTHIAGPGINHSWTQHPFGTDEITYKKFSFIINSGVLYLFGKEIKAAGHDFRYGNYLSVFSLPGVLYRPVRKGYLSLTAGPELDLYKNNLYAGMAAQLSGQYFLNKQVAIGPGITFKKRPDTGALWTIGLGTSYLL